MSRNLATHIAFPFSLTGVRGFSSENFALQHLKAEEVNSKKRAREAFSLPAAN
jgi:hypothetical protein